MSTVARGGLYRSGLAGEDRAIAIPTLSMSNHGCFGCVVKGVGMQLLVAVLVVRGTVGKLYLTATDDAA